MAMMHVAPSGKNLICRNCIDRKPVQKQEQAKSMQKARPQKQDDSPIKEYFCKECKYNFKRAKHLLINTCPYCDSGNVITKGSTARIVADAFRMKGG